MKKTLWLLLGFAPIGFGFVDWKTESGLVFMLVLTVSALCCAFSMFEVVVGRIQNPGTSRIVLVLFLAAALLLLDFCLAIYAGCILHPMRI
jgi:hypothetical protein